MAQVESSGSDSSAQELRAPLLINSDSEIARDETRFQVASMYIDDALHKRKTEAFKMKGMHDEQTVRIFFIIHNKWWKRCVWIFIFLQMCLTFYERASSFKEPPLPHTRLLAGIELICLSIYVVDIILRSVALGARNYFLNAWNMIKCLVVLTMFCDVTVVMIFENSFRFSRILRAYILLQHSRTVRGLALNVIRTIPKTLPVFLIIGFFIVIYALLGTILFSKKVPTDPDFSSLRESIVSMYILTTTENFPDVMIPEYLNSRWYAIFFLSFLMITQLFLMNLVLAVFYQNYADQMMVTYRKELRYRKDSLNKAFDLMKSPEGVVELPEFERTMRNMFRFQSASKGKIQFMFHMLDKDYDQSLNPKEFAFLCDIMEFTIKELEVIPGDDQNRIRLARSALQRATETRLWKWAMIATILLSTALIVAQVGFCKFGEEADGSCVAFVYTEFAFTGVFVVELVIQIVANGAANFFKSNWNKFDFLVVVVCVVDIALYYAPNINIEYLFLVRSLLLLRVIANLETLQIVISTTATLFPALVSFLAILGCIFYIYAIIGMETFYGVINEDNPWYSDNDYWAINFDNFANALIALYILMTVNNWNTFMGGMVYATNRWTRIFYCSFYVVAVVIVLNVVVAFTIEVFVEQHQLNTAARKQKVEDQISGSRSVHDEEIKTRIKLAMQRSQTQNRFRVIPQRNLNALLAGMYRTNPEDEDSEE
eukprot:TRINITY_DN3754_c0_g1_i1.p1 TRINITY_DN3754_c0_g1~~TRINITY_DN3754_c0_g1_i1.p1  ORF type:complete len:714 (+),score=138.48 TRINITY_DN3754_c0_g1_i1:108-2249(+)